MKRLLLFIIPAMVGCEKPPPPAINPNEVKLFDKPWEVHFYSLNGISDPAIATYKKRYQFRSDGQLCYSQINPAYTDTFHYAFTTDENIRISKFWIYPIITTYLTIDKLTDHEFDFTTITDGSSDLEIYKTTKQ